MYLSIKVIAAKYNLDAFTIGCYPQLMGKVCIAASLLADEGIPFACEGDINGATGQLILTLLSGQPTHNTDFLDPLEDGTVIFTHCGSGSLSLAENKDKINLTLVRLMGQGACVRFPAKPGPVTLLSLIAKDNGYQIAMLHGEALKTEMVFPGNPIRIRFEENFNEINDWIFNEGIGHHWMIAYGSYSEEIWHWNKIAEGNLSLKEL
jgi:L-fucose isomerase-like protein